MNTIPWNRFLIAARLGTPDQVPVALIVDSPWLPGYAGIDTRDYFLFPDQWLKINLELLQRFPDAVWIPGFWVEFGMACASIQTARLPLSRWLQIWPIGLKLLRSTQPIMA
jgi:uroporphyrinogen decarboxylase